METIDYLCLGQTVPERSKKYGLRVCTAGIDLKTNRLVRIYPLGIRKEHHFKRWNIYHDLPVRLNPKDSRSESYRLNIDIEELIDIKSTKYKGDKRETIINFYNETLIEQLNIDRKSLAIIKLIKPEGYFVNHSKNPVNVIQYCLFDDVEEMNSFGKESYKLLPRVKFKDEINKPHDLMYNSWDAYQHQVNLADKYGVNDLWKVMDLNPKKPKFALIGNMNHQRNTWLIITIFNITP